MKGDRPIVALITEDDSSETIVTFKENGKFSTYDSPADLIVIGPYDGFKIDDPVMVRDEEGKEWQRRHFAGVSEASGNPMTFTNGNTSWTQEGIGLTPWLQCRRPTKEELE